MAARRCSRTAMRSRTSRTAAAPPTTGCTTTTARQVRSARSRSGFARTASRAAGARRILVRHSSESRCSVSSRSFGSGRGEGLRRRHRSRRRPRRRLRLPLLPDRARLDPRRRAGRRLLYPAGFAVFLAPLGRLDLEPRASSGTSSSPPPCSGPPRGSCARPRRSSRSLAIFGPPSNRDEHPRLHTTSSGDRSPCSSSRPPRPPSSSARARSTTSSAALLGIAAAIKMYPLVFIGWFFLRRDWSFVRALRARAASSRSSLLPALVMGPRARALLPADRHPGVVGAQDGVLYDFNSQFAPAVLARYYGGWGVAARRSRELGQLGAWVAPSRHDRRLLLLLSVTKAKRIIERRELWAFVLLASTVPFWLKTSWTHYFAHLPVAQVLLASTLVERRRPRDLPFLVLLVAPSVSSPTSSGCRAPKDGCPTPSRARRSSRISRCSSQLRSSRRRTRPRA